MRAAVAGERGGKPAPVISERNRPTIGPLDVLIKVSHAAINRADLLQVKGLYPPPKGATDILGLEAAGEVVETGKNVESVRKGDRFCTLLVGGGCAEFVATDHRMLLDIPDSMKFETAAAIPEVWYTAYLNLVIEGQLQKNERVLIHAGASGVGLAAIQIAKQYECEVAVTVGSDKKADFCKSLGADVAFNYNSEDFSELETGVDVILDPVGGKYFERNIELLRKGGRLVSIGLMGGGESGINLKLLLGKSLRIIGSTLRGRALEEKISLTERVRTEVMPLISRGEFKPIIDSLFDLEEIHLAHEKMAKNETMGKVILQVS